MNKIYKKPATDILTISGTHAICMVSGLVSTGGGTDIPQDQGR